MKHVLTQMQYRLAVIYETPGSCERAAKIFQLSRVRCKKKMHTPITLSTRAQRILSYHLILEPWLQLWIFPLPWSCRDCRSWQRKRAILLTTRSRAAFLPFIITKFSGFPLAELCHEVWDCSVIGRSLLYQAAVGAGWKWRFLYTIRGGHSYLKKSCIRIRVRFRSCVPRLRGSRVPCPSLHILYVHVVVSLFIRWAAI